MPSDSPATSTARASIAFALGCVFFAYAFIQRVSPSVMTAELMRDFAVGGTALGILSAMYLYPYALAQLPVGMLMDRYGPRPLLTITALICAISSCWFASAESLLMASIARGFVGVSVAFAFVGTLTIAATFFHASRFALLSGIVFTVGMTGAVAGQVPLRILVDLLSWRETYYVLGAAALMLAVLIVIFVPSRVPPATRREGSALNGLGAVCTNRQNWLCAIAGFGASATMLSFSGLWAVPWMTMTLGFDERVAAGISSMIFVGWGMSSPVLGWLSDRLGTRKPILVGGALVALIALVLIVYGRLTSPLLLGALFFLHGAGACSMVVCFSLCRENNIAANSATAISLVNMCIVAGGAVMQPLLGWLLDLRWDGQLREGVRHYTVAAFDGALLGLIVVLGIALLCALLIRETGCKSVAR
ncbi:MAG: MFS transporter [Gammaproteobacteria bacterium]|nr:MFS transporter [Gammaproteobacteria bacterium]